MIIQDVVQYVPWTIQGEGRFMGKKITLLRFRKCLRKCPFCDTQGILEQDSFEIPAKQIAEDASKTGMLLITGGEPLIYTTTIVYLVSFFNHNPEYKKPLVSIETAGNKGDYQIKDLIYYTTELHITFSPKIYNETDLEEAIRTVVQLKAAEIHNPQYKWDVKILVPFINEKLYETFLDETIHLYGPQGDKLWFMPMGKTKEEIESNLNQTIEIAKKYNGNVSYRLHLVFGVE